MKSPYTLTAVFGDRIATKTFIGVVCWQAEGVHVVYPVIFQPHNMAIHTELKTYK